MIDESMDKEAMKQEPKPWEFRSKPAWQRFFVMFGGVFFNFILAILIYSATLFTWGEEYLKTEDAVYGVHCNDLAREIGFENGDKIISFDGEKVLKFNELHFIDDQFWFDFDTFYLLVNSSDYLYNRVINAQFILVFFDNNGNQFSTLNFSKST